MIHLTEKSKPRKPRQPPSPIQRLTIQYGITRRYLLCIIGLSKAVCQSSKNSHVEDCMRYVVGYTNKAIEELDFVYYTNLERMKAEKKARMNHDPFA